MKKRMLIYLLIAALLCTALSGCSAKKTGNNPSTVSNENTDKSSLTSAADSTDYNKAYADVLADIYKLIAVSSKDDSFSPDDGEYGIFSAAQGQGENALDSIGYLLLDISGDNVPELLIILSDSDASEPHSGSEILAAYTYYNNEPVYIFESYYRSAYRYMTGNKLMYEGSDSAMVSIFGEYTLSGDGRALVCKDYYFSDAVSENSTQIAYYHNTSGKVDASASEKLDITSEEFWAYRTKLSETVEALKYTPMSEYKASSKADASKATLGADYFENVSDKYSDYNSFTADNSDYSVKVLFFTDIAVKSFKVLKLTVGDDGNDDISYQTSEMYVCEDLTPDKPVAVTMSFPGSLPQYAVSYVDADGETLTFAVSMSGENESIVLSAIQP